MMVRTIGAGYALGVSRYDRREGDLLDFFWQMAALDAGVNCRGSLEAVLGARDSSLRWLTVGRGAVFEAT